MILRRNQISVFGDAKYLINKSRQEMLRLPERLPEEESLEKLRDFTLDRLKVLTESEGAQCSKPDFVEITDLICARLTLFNARPGR